VRRQIFVCQTLPAIYNILKKGLLMKALIIYYSATGNTEKAAFAIRKGLEAGGAEVAIMRVEEA
jgi:flavorubredoxin